MKDSPPTNFTVAVSSVSDDTMEVFLGTCKYSCEKIKPSNYDGTMEIEQLSSHSALPQVLKLPRVRGPYLDGHRNEVRGVYSGGEDIIPTHDEGAQIQNPGQGGYSS